MKRIITLLIGFLLLAFLGLTVHAQDTSPVPFVSLPLVPSSVPPVTDDFVLTVNGSQFVGGSTVNWNGMALATAVVSATQLTATIPASSVATAGTALVTVSSPPPGGGVSNRVPFTIRNASPSVVFAFSTMDVGTSPNDIVVTDFNNDGIEDLAWHQTKPVDSGNVSPHMQASLSPDARIQKRNNASLPRHRRGVQERVCGRERM